MDPLTYEPQHAVMGYYFNGEYCGDFELNPKTLMDARSNRDFTDVIKQWPAHTFIPDTMYLECNKLYDDGEDIKLPDCESVQEDYEDEPTTSTGYEDVPEEEDEPIEYGEDYPADDP